MIKETKYPTKENYICMFENDWVCEKDFIEMGSEAGMDNFQILKAIKKARDDRDAQEAIKSWYAKHE